MRTPEDAFGPDERDAARHRESPGVALIEHGDSFEVLGGDDGRSLSALAIRSCVGPAERPTASLDLGEIRWVGERIGSPTHSVPSTSPR